MLGEGCRHLPRNRFAPGLRVVLRREVAVAEVRVAHCMQVVDDDYPLSLVAVGHILHVSLKQVEQVGAAKAVDLIDVFREDVENRLPSAPFAYLYDIVQVLDSRVLVVQLAGEMLDVVAG